MRKSFNRKFNRIKTGHTPLKYKGAKLRTSSNKGSKQLVVINKEELDILSEYILDYKNIETGGQLFGYWTQDGNPVILFVLGPGPNAGHYSAYFMQDIDYLKSTSKTLMDVYGLSHIGEWHSHHQLGLTHPSSHDSHNISSNIRKLGYDKFLLCIGTCNNSTSTVNAYMFYSDEEEYKHIPWKVMSHESPFRKILKAEDRLKFISPSNRNPNMSGLFTVGHNQVTKLEYKPTYWMKYKENNKILKEILDFTKAQNPLSDCEIYLDDNNEVHLMIEDEHLGKYTDIHFVSSFPMKSPEMSNETGAKHSPRVIWDYKGDILEAYKGFYNSLKNI